MANKQAKTLPIINNKQNKQAKQNHFPSAQFDFHKWFK